MKQPVSPNAQAFAVTLDDCRQALDRLTRHVEDHLGHTSEEINERHVAQAGRLLLYHRQASSAAGIPLDPAP